MSHEIFLDEIERASWLAAMMQMMHKNGFTLDEVRRAADVWWKIESSQDGEAEQSRMDSEIS